MLEVSILGFSFSLEFIYHQVSYESSYKDIVKFDINFLKGADVISRWQI